jgi:hypothetical protein
MRLISDHVYSLPDGKELVARRTAIGDRCLHDPSRGVASAPVYLVDCSGRLLSWERFAMWTVSDLHDTGKVLEDEMRRLQML